MNICENLRNIKNTIPEDVKLVVVSKTRSIEEIEKIYNCGNNIFGENKVQELIEKHEKLPKDIEWHMIGHLQSNKVKYISPFVSLIHGIDSKKLIKEIDKRAKINNRNINGLLQIHIAEERSKFGFSIDEIDDVLEEVKKYNNLNIIGLMGMATFTNDKEKIQNEFKSLQSVYLRHNNTLNTLSIGMSGDYNIAIECGSNMIRIGSSIFGKRNLYEKNYI